MPSCQGICFHTVLAMFSHLQSNLAIENSQNFSGKVIFEDWDQWEMAEFPFACLIARVFKSFQIYMQRFQQPNQAVWSPKNELNSTFWDLLSFVVYSPAA